MSSDFGNGKLLVKLGLHIEFAQLLPMWMRFCEHIYNGNIAAGFCDGEGEGETNTSGTPCDNNRSAIKGEQVLYRTLQEAIRICLKKLLGLYQNRIVTHIGSDVCVCGRIGGVEWFAILFFKCTT
jgi:hypothetical protein